MCVPLYPFCFGNILSDGRYECTSIRVNVFESGIVND